MDASTLDMVRSVACVFHAKAATDSRARLPPFPDESCHVFQGKAATLAG